MATYKLLQIINKSRDTLFSSIILSTLTICFAMYTPSATYKPYSLNFCAMLFVKIMGYVSSLVSAIYCISCHAGDVNDDTCMELQRINENIQLLKNWKRANPIHLLSDDIMHHVQHGRLVKSSSQSCRLVKFYASDIRQSETMLVLQNSIDVLEAHAQVLESDSHGLFMFYQLCMRVIMPGSLILNFVYCFA